MQIPTMDPKAQTADLVARECPKLNVSLLSKSLPHNVVFIPGLFRIEIPFGPRLLLQSSIFSILSAEGPRIARKEAEASRIWRLQSHSESSLHLRARANVRTIQRKHTA